MSAVEKNDPEMERLYDKALALGFTGGENAYVVRKDERGIIRLAPRTMRSPIVEYVGRNA